MDRRTATNILYSLAAVVGALALMTSPLLFFGHGHAGPGVHGSRVLAVTFVAALSAVWALFFAIRIFRNQDEFGRTGTQFAWYWGGSLGILATLPLYAFITLGGLHWLNPLVPSSRELARAFQLGYMLAVGGLTFGMMVAWVVWKVRTR